MPRRAARLTGLGTSVFTEMTALAQRTGAINLGQGPRCARRCWSINGSITAWSPRTFGATEAIAAALLALCDPGDEVIALEPFYDSYCSVS